jgi:hypothetical protein
LYVAFSGDYARIVLIGKRKVGFIEPMLPWRFSKLSEGAAWSYELKFDGYPASGDEQVLEQLSRRHQLRDEAGGFQIIANAVIGSDYVVLTIGSSEGWLSVIRVKYLWNFEHLLSLGKLLRLGICHPHPPRISMTGTHALIVFEFFG